MQPKQTVVWQRGLNVSKVAMHRELCLWTKDSFNRQEKGFCLMHQKTTDFTAPCVLEKVERSVNFPQITCNLTTRGDLQSCILLAFHLLYMVQDGLLKRIVLVRVSHSCSYQRTFKSGKGKSFFCFSPNTIYTNSYIFLCCLLLLSSPQ